MLTALRVVDLKGIRDLTVSLRPLSVFVGPNGVGKTTLLEAVYLAGLLVRNREGPGREKFGEGRWDLDKVCRRGADRLRIELTFSTGAILLEAPGRGDDPLAGRWLHPHGQEPLAFAHLGAVKLDGNQRRDFTAQETRDIEFVEQAVRARLDAGAIAAPARMSGVTRLSGDGAGLAAFLDSLNRRRDGTLDAIEEAVQRVVPRFRRVELTETSIATSETEYLTVDGQRVPRTVARNYASVGLSLVFDKDTSVPAEHASEGTLLTLGLLALAHASGKDARRLILIDDLDRALHPSAQHRLVEGLQHVLAAAPGLQILATTHSPDLVDACDARDVVVLGRDAAGSTAARTLAEHPEAAKCLKLLRVGEFWGTVGEDWVSATETRP